MASLIPVISTVGVEGSGKMVAPLGTNFNAFSFGVVCVWMNNERALVQARGSCEERVGESATRAMRLVASLRRVNMVCDCLYIVGVVCYNYRQMKDAKE